MGSLATKNTKSTEAWPKVRLGEVCEILAGDSAPQDKRLYENGKYPFVRTSDVGDIHFGVITDSRDHLNDAGVKKLRVFPKGSILFPKSGASTFLNHRVMLGMDARVVSHLAVIIPREKLDSKFLLHLLFTVDAKELMQDSGYPSLRAADIAKVEFSLPPLSVQREIVARLEKELASVDRMVKGFEAMKAEADQLFKAELKEAFEDIKRRGAETRRLGEIGRVAMCKRVLKHQTSFDGGIPFYKIGTFGKTPNAYISKELFEELAQKYSYPRKGDVLISAAGTIGRTVVFDGSPSYFQDSNIVWLEHDGSRITNEYLKVFYWNSPWKVSDGATIPRLYNGDVEGLEIPVPPLTAQREIVAKLDAVREKCAKLKSAAEEGLKTAALLRKAILKEAFSSCAEATEDKE